MALIVTKAERIRKLRFLPAEVLEKLKCTNCADYLSTPPIWKHPVRGSLCGLCAPNGAPIEGYVRNIEYELLATYVAFPREKRMPCGEKEPHCIYKHYQCPGTDTACTWFGSMKNLKKHYQKNHADFVLCPVSCFSPELRRNCEEFRLLSSGGNLFLVQTKCLVASAKLLCVVRSVGDVRSSGLFQYQVCLFSKEQKSRFQSSARAVQTDISLKMDETFATVVDLEELMKLLDSPGSVRCAVEIIRLKKA